jgi:hypothetical protein
MVGTDTDGKDVVLATGGYVTIWRPEKDGKWNVIFDTSSPAPPVPAKK